MKRVSLNRKNTVTSPFLNRGVHKGRTLRRMPFVVASSYLDGFGNPVAEAHEFIRADGSRAASGMPDPKRLIDGKRRYVLRKGNG